MKYILTFLFVLYSFIIVAQVRTANEPRESNTPFHIENLSDSLKKKGVSNFIAVKRSFYGMHILDSLGGPSEHYYIFWQEGATTYFQEIKSYYDTTIRCQIENISDSGLFPLMKNYFDTIKTEELLPFILKSKVNDIESYNLLMPIHQEHYDLFFYFQNETVNKSFERTYLDKDFGSTWQNLNYTYNNNTKLILIWNKLWKQIRRKSY